MRARLVSVLAAAATLSAVLVTGTPAQAGSGGNSGTVKISEVGGPADESNDPHVGCSFDVQWYGFDRSTSAVTFTSQAPTKDAVITRTFGPGSVSLGDPASGSELNAIRTYTLSFSGADPQPQQGYHVKLEATGAKSKTFWVDCDRADVPTPDVPPTDPRTPEGPFDWDWKYATPTCDALTVAYPSTIPAGQANDANVRFQTPSGPLTLNFHHNTGTWSGTHVFDFTSHPQWPAGLTTYHVVWVQVGGTNYHWQGDVSCSPPPPPVTEGPFDWDWKYADPTCTGLTVAYPSNIPSGQANDASIRFESDRGQFTLNFHHNTGTWSGSHVFDYTSHPQWPAGVTSFRVVWVQVGGTNYHWEGSVPCVVDGGAAKAVTEVVGFRTGTVTLPKGRSVATDAVLVGGAGYQDLVLQQLTGTTWTDRRTITTDADGVGLVTFPKLAKRGTYQFRLAIVGSGISTGDATGTLTVRIR